MNKKMEPVSYKWTEVTNRASFAPRDGAGALVFNDAMWMIGGWNPRDKEHFPLICNNEVWKSENGIDWDLIKPNSFLDDTFDPLQDWSGRHTAGYAVHENAMWIVGGDANQAYYQNDVWTSENGRDWTRVHAEVPWGPRVLHYTVSFHNRLWVMGGQTAPGFAEAEEHFYDDIWASPDGIKWNKMVPQEPHWCSRGMIGGHVVFKDRIWILGGGRYDTPQTPDRAFYNDVWSSPDGIHWHCHIQHAPWTARQYHEVAVFDGRMWVLEGWNQSNRNDVWYSDDGETWIEVPDTPWPERHAASVYVYQNALWIVAGNNMTSDVWKLARI